MVRDAEQVILESDPSPASRLHLGHTFTPEWAAAHGFERGDGGRLACAAALEGRLTSIEEAGEGVVKLTVVHDGFAPGRAPSSTASAAAGRRCSPSLKTLLETGAPLP